MGMICSVLKLLGSAAMQIACMETCTLHRRVNLSALHFWAYTLQEISILLFSKWNQHPFRQGLLWNQHSSLFWPKNRHFWAYALREMNISLVSKWNQHPCHHRLTWNQHFNLFWPEINSFELTRCREMNISLVSKWNQHPCCHALAWNQHFNLFWPEINIFELTRCAKWTFCPFLSEINILAVTR